MKVEFLRAWEDKTWDTEILEVPTIQEDRENGVDFDIGDLLNDALIDWANKTLIVPGNRKYDGLALFAVYNNEPESLLLEEIRGVCEIVRRIAFSGNVRWALTGGAALRWLGAPKDTFDLDFVADKPLPVAAEEEYPNGYRYKVGGRRVDWTVQKDERKPLFDAALDAAIMADGLPIIPTHYLIAFKLSAESSVEKHLADINFIQRHLHVDHQLVRFLVDKYGLQPMPEEEE